MGSGCSAPPSVALKMRGVGRAPRERRARAFRAARQATLGDHTPKVAVFALPTTPRVPRGLGGKPPA